MTEEAQQQESQKTVVAFVAGLLIGGLLVWIFSSPSESKAPTITESNEEATEEISEEAPVSEVELEEEVVSEEVTNMEVGDGEIIVDDQPAGTMITLESATFPTEEGWVAVRTYPNGQLGSILGASRYSQSQNLVPDSIQLLVPTTPGRTYAVVFFTEDGDREFNLAGDVQIDGVLSTFTAE